MKILVITANYPPDHHGGYELRCQMVLTQLAARGHQICVVSNQMQTSPLDDAGERIEVNRVLHLTSAGSIKQRLWRDYQDLRFLKHKIQAFKPDLIYLWHTIDLTRAIFPFLARQNIQIVYDEGGMGLVAAWTKHGDWFNLMDRVSRQPWKNWLKQQVGAIINWLSGGTLLPGWQWPAEMFITFNSVASLDCARRSGVPVDKARVIHSGLDTDLFSFLSKQHIGKPVEILLPGRIVPIKGIQDAITVLSNLNGNGIDTRLTIIGTHDDLAYIEAIKAEIDANGLQGKVAFEGQETQQELVVHYHSADICLFPSYQKMGLSRVPLEAMATGCLVISYGNEGASEIIEHGVTGHIVPEGDMDAITTIVQTLLSEPETCRQNRVNARRYVEANHALDTYIDKIEVLLREGQKQ